MKMWNAIMEHKAALSILIVIVLVINLFVMIGSLVSVSAGDKGVITSAPDASQIGRVLDEGWHIDPYFLMCHIEQVRYNTQTVEFSVVVSGETLSNLGPVNVRTADNLEVEVDFSLTYNLPHDKVGYIRITYGDYQHTILQQVCRSVPRDIASMFQGLDLAGPMRPVFEQMIATNITERLEHYNINVEMVNLRSINLPDDVDAAVQRKKVAEQDLITANYTALRMMVLAQGQANAAVINATGFAQATIIKANGTAQAIDVIMAIMTVYDSNASVDSYLTQQFITALNDPNSNIQYVVLYNGNGAPFIIDLSGKTTP